MLTYMHTRGLCFGNTDDDRTLIVTMEIECEDCGVYSIVLAGHHVRSVAQALLKIADMVPDLTPMGEVEETPIQVVTPTRN